MFSGLDDIDKWTDQKLWDAALQNIHVVVSTPAVLYDALSHGFVPITKIALLVFDEGICLAALYITNFFLMPSQHIVALEIRQ